MAEVALSGSELLKQRFDRADQVAAERQKKMAEGPKKIKEFFNRVGVALKKAELGVLGSPEKAAALAGYAVEKVNEGAEAVVGKATEIGKAAEKGAEKVVEKITGVYHAAEKAGNRGREALVRLFDRGKQAAEGLVARVNKTKERTRVRIDVFGKNVVSSAEGLVKDFAEGLGNRVTAGVDRTIAFGQTAAGAFEQAKGGVLEAGVAIRKQAVESLLDIAVKVDNTSGMRAAAETANANRRELIRQADELQRQADALRKTAGVFRAVN